MTGYFDERETIHYLNLCHLIKLENEKIYEDPRTADIQAAICISKSETVGIARLLIDKGIITPEEYTLALTDGLQVTLESMRKIAEETTRRKNWFRRMFGD